MRALLVSFSIVLGFVASAAHAAVWCVKPGDTLTSIAESTGHTVAELQAMNRLTDDHIRAGQALIYIDGGDIARAVAKLEESFKQYYGLGSDEAREEELRYRAWALREIERLKARKIAYDFRGSSRDGVHFTKVVSHVLPTRKCEPTYAVQMLDPIGQYDAQEDTCTTRDVAEKTAEKYRQQDSLDRKYTIVECPPAEGCNPCAPP